MSRLYSRPIFIASVLVVPYLVLASPGWMRLFGIAPYWPVVWLLPWALVDGPFSGAIAGLFLGLILDAISLDGPTQIPALIALGWWWGSLGARNPHMERSLNLGLMAWLGTVVVGISLWVQIVFAQLVEPLEWFMTWAGFTLLAQSLITGLVAPIISSLLLLTWRKPLNSLGRQKRS